MEPIAVVGFSFKMPQEAVDEGSLWEVLEHRNSLMTEWPGNRIKLGGFYDDGSAKPHTIIGRGGHFIKDDPTAFDAPFFSITAKEASAMDPQQRWILETSYHAFENAGMTLESLKDSQMAVFEASMSDDYAKILSKDPDRIPVSATTGNAQCIRANRVSWHFGLRGPSVHIDTACSSSLVAVDMACQSLRSGDASAALVLGCNLMLGPEISLGLGNQGFLSPSSLCYSFDHRADGYSRGEGFVAMVLKPLSEAIKDNDTIRALIRATGSNSDGHTPSMTQPSAEAQESLIRHVYQKAGLELRSTRYFEAHGTGTPVGDPIEMKAIGKVFRASRSTEEPLYVGSIKANIGHLEGAAGLAGIVKAILILERGSIPPNALFEKLNPDVDAGYYHIKVPEKVVRWPSSGVRRVSVNSFGMGGANAHVVLDDALSYLQSHGLQGHHQCRALMQSIDELVSPSSLTIAMRLGTPTSSVYDEGGRGTGGNEKTAAKLPGGPHGSSSKKRLLVWTAGDENGIGRVTDGLKVYYETKVMGCRSMVSRLAYTLAAKRTHLPWRTFAIVNSDGSHAHLTPTKAVRASTGQMGLGFVFTGQGAQYVNMGLELLQYPAFERNLSCIDALLRDVGCQWSIFDELGNKDNINRPEYSQTLCTALQIALVGLLKELGVEPIAVVGHSSGEIAAAYAVGALSMESAIKVAFYRGQVAEKLFRLAISNSPSVSVGAMLAVNQSESEARQYLETLSSLHTELETSMITRHVVQIACVNSPTNCTLSGPEQAINVLKKCLDDDGVFAQKINTGGIAYHSRAMKMVAEEYLELLSFLDADDSFHQGSEGFLNDSCRIPMISSVTGTSISAVELSNPQYWVDNLVSPVQFLKAISSLTLDKQSSHTTSHDTTKPMDVSDFLEVGPHPALRRFVQDAFRTNDESIANRSKRRKANYFSVLTRNSSPAQSIVELLGQLFCSGYPVSILSGNRQLHQKPAKIMDGTLSEPTLLTDLPKYPFNHSHKYWEESRLSANFRLRSGLKKTPDGSTDLLGNRVHDWNPLEPQWRNFLNTEDLPWIGDHIINNTNVLAGMCMVSMAIEAARQHFEDSRVNAKHHISGFLIKEAHFISPIIVSSTVKDDTETVLRLYPSQGSWQYKAKIFTCTKGNRWTECFLCTIQIQIEEAAAREIDRGLGARLETNRSRESYSFAIQSCTKRFGSTKFYEWLKTRADMHYQKAFALLEDIGWDGDRSAVARIGLKASSESTEKQSLHPVGAVLDAAAHLSVLSRSRGLTENSYTTVLTGLSNSWISAQMFENSSTNCVSSSLASILTVLHNTPSNQAREKSSVLGLNDQGEVLFSLSEVEMSPVSLTNKNPKDDGNRSRQMIHSICWKPQLSLLSPQSLQDYLDKVPVNEELETFMGNYYPKIEAAMAEVAQRAVEFATVPEGDTANSPQYMKAFVSALSHHYHPCNAVGTLQTQHNAIASDSGSRITDERLEALLLECEVERPSWKLFCEVARNLESIIIGEIDPLALIFDSGLGNTFYASLYDSNFTPRLHAFLELLVHENPQATILEVGAGTGSMTHQVLSTLKEVETRTGATTFSKYTYTDISAGFFTSARERFQEFEERIEFKTLDLEQGPHEEAFELESYDLILASSVLHATKELRKTLLGLRRLLKPNGYLVFLEIISPNSACGNVGFGVFPGWWLSTEKWRSQSPLIPEEKWDTVLKQTGFSGTDMVLRDFASDNCHFSSILISKKVPEDGYTETQGQWCNNLSMALPCSSISSLSTAKLALVIDENSNIQTSVANLLCRESDFQDRVQVYPWREEADAGYGNTLLAAASDPDVLVISLLELTAPFISRMSESSFYNMQRIMSGLRNLLWVTSTHDGDVESPFYCVTKGFLRVLRAEGIARYIVTLEIESRHFKSQLTSHSAADMARIYVSHISTVVRSSFSSVPGELEYIVSDGLLHIPRLTEEVDLNSKVDQLIHKKLQSGLWQPGPALELSVGTPGVLDSLHFTEDTVYNQRAEIGSDEVEMEAKAWPLSFRDVLLALGQMEYQTPGLECAGVVTRIGSSVNLGLDESSSTVIKVGDRVCMAMGGTGSMRTYPRGHRSFFYKIPDEVSFEAAAAALNPAMTAYYSLISLARLQKGEKVLIHSAAGATGQMALWIAKMVGADIYVTVSREAKKRLMIEKFEIPESHILYSRNTSFSQGIKQLTNGRGVDVILNSLSGEALHSSWECIAPYGRFVEIGKADILSNSSLPMRQFSGNVSFFSVDLFHMSVHNVPLYQSILSTVLRYMDQGVIRNPQPLNYFSISDIEGAFRFMQSGENAGRVIITAKESDIVQKLVRDEESCTFDPNVSYLIIGGLGGIGRAIMTWMAERGAKNIITFSRSGLHSSTSAAAQTVFQLEQQGVRIHAVKCDASSASEVRESLQNCSKIMPPIKGCINAVMDIHDTAFETMKYKQWLLSLKSKVATTWNIHQYFPIGSLDFFILLSSLAGICGTITQSNYAAGCTFQDAIAHQRAKQGENAVSLDLGWMRTIGKIAETEEYQRHRENQRDMLEVETAQLLGLLSIYCQPNNQKPQVMLGVATPISSIERGEAPSPLTQRTLFSGFMNSKVSGTLKSQGVAADDPAVLFKKATDVKGRKGVVINAVQARLGRALGISAETVEPDGLLSNYGVDSLMAVELRNWVGKEFKANIAIFNIMSGISIDALGSLIAERSEFRLA